MTATDIRNYLADSPPTVVRLEIKPHFDALTDDERLYAHYISRASFLGTRIVLRQISPESEGIYDLVLDLYWTCKGDWKELQKLASVSDDDLIYFLEYAGQFLGNVGNYKSFGDSKILPRLPENSFAALAATSSRAKELYGAIGKDIYASDDIGKMHLGYVDKGHMTTYYPDSPTITQEEITLVGDVLEANKVLPENTRLRKNQNGDFDLLIASAQESPTFEWNLPADGKLKGKKLRFVHGDYSKLMGVIAEAVTNARNHAANENQRRMHEEYAKAFKTGSMEAFLESQRYWIKDQKPKVESDLGFIETYRDPQGVRGEWEGFVAMVNVDRTRAFEKLVAAAESMIPKLPWSKDFEKDHFLSPDFTSLEVLSFAGSGIPAGINIPNFDSIRQNEGFKNVSLGNVLSAKAPDEKIPFIREEDLKIYQQFRDQAFEVQVGIHELLGHGTGKLLQETSPGVYNFDAANPPISPVTNKKVTSWYKPGQTWGSVFGNIAGSYEECRAECVAMALSCDFEILKIFGFGDGKEDLNGEAGDVLFVAYLQMARAGIGALELWDPSSRKWGQPHMQARYSILKCFLGAGDDFVKLQYTKDDLSDLTIALDRSKILTHGRPAVEKYLQQLHVYKSTADFEAGSQLYADTTFVDPGFWGGKVRAEVLKRKTPRKIFVQANTAIEKDKVLLKEYPPTLEGMIQSYAERNV